MSKIKIILPSLKEKLRYIVFEVISENKFGFNDVKKAIEIKSREFLGELGLARAGIIFLNDWKNNKGIIKVNNKLVNEIRVILSLIEKINNKRVILKTRGISGTLKKARSKFLN